MHVHACVRVFTTACAYAGRCDFACRSQTYSRHLTYVTGKRKGGAWDSSLIAGINEIAVVQDVTGKRKGGALDGWPVAGTNEIAGILAGCPNWHRNREAAVLGKAVL